MPPDSGNMAPSSAYERAIVIMIAAPSTHAHTALEPATPATRHAPNSHPDPMIELSPVNNKAMLPTSRRIGEGEFTRSCQPVLGGVAQSPRIVEDTPGPR